MKKFFRITTKEMRYGFGSPKFWGTVVTLAVLMLIDTLPLLYAGRTVDAAGNASFRTDILTLSLMTATGAGYIFYLRFCMYVIPYGCTFAEEFGQSAAKYRITRSSGRVYGAAKFATGILLTAAAIFAAEILFTLILKAQGVTYLLPQESEYDANYYLYKLVGEGHVGLFFLLLCFYKCLPGMFFAAMTMMLSAFIRNKFILVAMPVTLFFGVTSFCAILFPYGEEPFWASWHLLFFDMSTGTAGTEAAAVARTAIYTGVGILLFCVIFIRKVRRVVENE
ncbi:MAG: hypothetical protein LUE29_13225 [Lachnospiraceae bacterium]|nr:hypothetical protein [Lachnospiraceae bacterium]